MGRKRLHWRLNGFSTPFAGVQWVPNDGDHEIVRRVLNALEDRRILFNSHSGEDPEHCIESALQVREMLTGEINTRGIGDSLEAALKEIREIFTAFVDAMQTEKRQRGRVGGHSGMESALSSLRSLIGERLADLCGKYRIEITGRLRGVAPRGSEWFFSELDGKGSRSRDDL